MTVWAILFWASVALLVYTQLGYGLLLELLARIGRTPKRAPQGAAAAGAPLPRVSVIVPAYAEQSVITRRIENLRALDYPSELVEIVVACDGSPDQTAERARSAGADVVLELPRAGKVRAQNAAVQAAGADLLAFSDANTRWEPGALRALVAPFADSLVGYVCGTVQLVNETGSNQEGLYWRYEMRLRSLESKLRSITAGNGAIYATRREAYLEGDGIMGHDLGFPFNMVKRGWLALYVPAAHAEEKMVPSIEGEFGRKRRMSSQAWRTTLRCGMLSPSGYGPLYALMIFSHRLLRYLTPFLHLVALAATIALLSHGWVYVAALVAQLLLFGGALLAGAVPARPLLLARYYVATTTSLAFGLWDWLRRGAPATWDAVGGTR
jgi:cellulose synthase/poly-beta-1,6-N-acetylglucosamine synthase-like glycosyltransferase